MIDSHCHLDSPVLRRGSRRRSWRGPGAAGVAAFVCVGVGRGAEARRGRPSRWPRPSPTSSPRSASTRTTSRAMQRGGLGRAGRAGARAAGGRHRRDRPRLPLRPLAARRCSRPPTGASSRWRGRPGCRSSRTSATRTPTPRPSCARTQRRSAASSTASRAAWPRRAPTWTSASTCRSRDPHLQERGRHPRGGGLRAARPHPDRDRRPLPGAHPPPGRSATSRPTSSRRWRSLAGAARAAGGRGRRGDHREHAPAVPACRLTGLGSGPRRRQLSSILRASRELHSARSRPASLRGVRDLHREVRAQRHARRRLPRQPDAAARRRRRSRSRCSSPAARSRWPATGRSPG